MASQGTTGPDARYGSFGCPLDALSGFMSATGYDEANPLWSSMQVTSLTRRRPFSARG